MNRSSIVQRNNQPWVCCQLGAREHYSFPGMLHSEKSLAILITDIWVHPDSWLSHIKIHRFQNIKNRFHESLSSANIIDCTLQSVLFELWNRIFGLSGWQLTLEKNRWFQKKSVNILRKLRQQFEQNQQTPILFAYSYSALEILRYAKQCGWIVILGQIDGGQEDENLVAIEHKQAKVKGSTWKRAPTEYWVNWKEECNLADRIIVNSDWSRQLLSLAGIDKKKISIIPVAYESADMTCNWKRDYPVVFNLERPLKVLLLGTFSIRKGAESILEAMKILQSEPIEFWIVGKVDIAVPDEFNNSPKIKWIGRVQRHLTSEYYKNCDLFLFPTISDGFGMTQVESRGWKLPIIATPFCAPIVKHDQNGLVIPKSDGKLLADAIYYLFQNPAKLSKLAEGYQGESETYSPSSVSESVLDLIYEL